MLNSVEHLMSLIKLVVKTPKKRGKQGKVFNDASNDAVFILCRPMAKRMSWVSVLTHVRTGLARHPGPCISKMSKLHQDPVVSLDLSMGY